MLTTDSSIPLPFPEKQVFFRLGGRAGKSGMAPAFAQAYQTWSQVAFALCHPTGRSCTIGIIEIAPEGILLENGAFLPGKNFAESVAGCRKLWCAAATIGAELIAARDAHESVAAKSIFDAVGSECADAAMDFLHRRAIREAVRRNEVVSPRRYSPGYGDMPLSVQKLFFEYLKLTELGLTLTPENLIVPEKTVTAWAGISLS